MMMTHLYMDAYGESYETPFFGNPTSLKRPNISSRLITEKLEVPDIRASVERPRLSRLLERSIENFSATMISGRAGTGKTTAAAFCHRKRKTPSWYSVTPTDVDWPTFALHFEASLRHDGQSPTASSGGFPFEDPDVSKIENFLLDCFELTECPDLIVIDDAHHLFETAWFSDFLSVLIRVLPPSSHLLMTCRSRPPAPLWRLRSKQVLNVIDEKLLYFSADEAEDLYRLLDIDLAMALEHQRLSFGHPQKLLKLAAEGIVKLSRKAVSTFAAFR
jgi:ATP/maltotriose-dependent transcriptional regulator MalT